MRIGVTSIYTDGKIIQVDTDEMCLYIGDCNLNNIIVIVSNKDCKKIGIGFKNIFIRKKYKNLYLFGTFENYHIMNCDVKIRQYHGFKQCFLEIRFEERKYYDNPKMLQRTIKLNALKQNL